MTENPRPLTLSAALAALDGAHEALRLAMDELRERDARIAALESAARDAAILAAASCGDALTPLRSLTLAESIQPDNHAAVAARREAYAAIVPAAVAWFQAAQAGDADAATAAKVALAQAVRRAGLLSNIAS
jgi:hypothetical protein